MLKKSTLSLGKHMTPARLVLVAVIAFITALFADHAVHAGSQEPALTQEAAATVPPYAEFQSATFTGTNNVINATNVPVVTATGTTYKDLTFTVDVAANGTITIAPGSPTVVVAPVTQAAGFKAGTYVAPSTQFSGGGLYTVSGPGVTAGGATVWSVAAAAGANSATYPASATWYVGAPTAANNPLAARLKKAGITSTAYSYGVLGAGGCCSSSWEAGSLLGLSQTGNAITVATFSNSGLDYASPKDQITITLKP